MSRAPAIARRELSSYFFSPIAYVALALFVLASDVAFLDDFTPGQPAEMRHIFQWMVWLLVFIIPILSMGLMAQEWATGTIESLMTAPVSESDVVLGKFLGSLSFFGVLLVPTLLFPVMLAYYGHIDSHAIACGYLGIVLVGALFISIGLFCSSLTKSQVVAAVASAAILFATTIVPWWIAGKATLSQFWREVADQCVFHRYEDFSKGILYTPSLVFFLAATFVFLFLTIKVLESRRWA
ncbi:MAG: ABC transporter permease [Tepidisphaeraceae bacterium]|jgi:ABC-2 type transport system permease protein